MRDVFITTDTFVRKDTIQQRLMETGMRHPHSAAPDTHAVIKMTERGKQMYRMIIKNRPAVTSVDGDKYIFDWPEMQLEDYFRRFGKEAVVLRPRRLKDKLLKYYSEAADAYENKSGSYSGSPSPV